MKTMIEVTMNKDELDPLIDEVIHYVLIEKKVDKNNIIKKFNIGYNRMLRILDQIEELKIISGKNIHGERDILINNTYKFTEHKTINNEKITIDNAMSNANKNWVTDLILLSGILGIIVFIYIFFSSNKEKEIDYCSDSVLAYTYSKELIAKTLKSPTTAKFPPYSDIRIRPINNCQFEIDGYVDAHNSFGAMIRTKYKANIKYDNKTESYYLEKLNM
ncbi:hypothetical protein CBW54_02915 [Yersinia kristensenii]|nr:hypothetical protein CBW54_02915 [Yersinia kristensenii]